MRMVFSCEPYGLECHSWGIREGKVPTFEALEQVLWFDQHKDSDGNVYPVRFTLQDAMGHRTSEVYDFCRMHRGLILPTMGKQTMSTPYAYSNREYYPGSKKPIPGGIKLVRFDTNYFKNQLAGILEVVSGDPGCWHYHSQITQDWARQMTVEGINDKGVWENPQERPNHAWDCATLLLLAHEVLGVAFWPVLEHEVHVEKSKRSLEPNEPITPRRINYARPSWLNR
jgi:terminase, large subunit